MLRRAVIAATLASLIVVAAAAEPRHGFSTFGDLKYGPDFKYFAYVNPDAPKGGEVRFGHGEGSFDNLNPFINRGIRLPGNSANVVALPFETLMTPATDEADAMYGLIAESIDIAPDRTAVTFALRPQARWHDGSPITVEDVVFSFAKLRDKGAPSYRLLYRDIEAVEAIDARRVRFKFRDDAILRDLPQLAASMPILSQAYFSKVEFDRTTLEPPLASGPYRIVEVNPNRSIVLRRVEDYWGRDLPVNRGRWNFDRIRLEFYRDRTIEFEAFKAGEFDFREEFTSKRWATEYDFPAIKDGRVVRETLADDSPAPRQYFVLNTRREKFADRRVREAFNLAFDFEWTNRNLFYDLYERTKSVFQNSEMAARELPDDLELEFLNPYRDRLPAELFTKVWEPPVSDGSGNSRAQLARARNLLIAAGWAVRDGKLKNARGQTFELEFLLEEPTFERILAPIAKNLERLGIEARIRQVESAQYASRMQTYDFDVTTKAFVTPATPGINERNFWGSKAAATEGGLNYIGIADPVVDDLLERIAHAQDRRTLRAASRALDRVLMWNSYVIPQWYLANDLFAYWDMFARPAVKPKFANGVLDTWWIDPAKAAKVDRSNR
jgi:microcin C transport system substrate-binding protein